MHDFLEVGNDRLVKKGFTRGTELAFEDMYYEEQEDGMVTIVRSIQTRQRRHYLVASCITKGLED